MEKVVLSFWEKVERVGKEYQKSLEDNYRKENGIYYTGLELAEEMVRNALVHLDREKPIYQLRFLEPCGGIGNFVFSYLKYVYEHYQLNSEEVKTLLRNLYYCEADEQAQGLYQELLIECVEIFFGYQLDRSEINIGGPLLYCLSQQEVAYIPITSYFGEIKFDIIITNPPYKSLRAERRHFSSEEEYQQKRKFYEELKQDARTRFPASSKGTMNIYQQFVEEIAGNYASENSILSLLVPWGILTDRSCYQLRKYLLETFHLKGVGSVPERMGYVMANQALAFLTLQKNGVSDYVDIVRYRTSGKEKFYERYQHVVRLEYLHSILVLAQAEYQMLEKLAGLPKVKDPPFIKNLRGEFDLTIHARYLGSAKTPYPLVKGRDLHKFQFVEGKHGFVDPEFVHISPKAQYIHMERLASQQITNAQKQDRLVFAPIPRNYVLGNSCNFIVVEENELGIDSLYLLGIFNSPLLNWYFKLFSSNNHVNNYEIDNLPLPIGTTKQRDKIVGLVQKYLATNKQTILEQLNMEVEGMIGNIPLGETEKRDNSCISGNYVLNNKSYKLSALDMEIVQAIPPGGNWRCIPQDTINKSRRLLGMQKTGGRTTLYGRLSLSKPSYTITTYFNRPGNGCYIHPVHHRVITTREAARLQSFLDSYYFLGNQKDILNQIGNAVPPIIGYIFGMRLKERLGITTAVDLFSGAGGLLSGMKSAGVKHILANDIDPSACQTLRFNHPSLEVIEGDITERSIKEGIIAKSVRAKVDLICGGPPCQGFSLAGFRAQDDPRNQLFRDFYEIVEKVMPKGFLFENVIGLLSYNKGETYQEIQTIFRELGYQVLGKVIKTNEFGVPQKRNRVIIIGVRDDLGIDPSSLFPEPIIKESDKQITVLESIGNLIDITVDSEQETVRGYHSVFEQAMAGIISLGEYVAEINKSRS